MASIIKASINLSEIPKDKIYVGKKGKYLPITITLNDDVDQFGIKDRSSLNKLRKNVNLNQLKPI